ncbi:hypothetical protein [Sphaerisporangium corydalis]|uniref:Uncharacterized protein n=1 Tax=Sphaerisporangium corydalis TaxID=1441875 RepID=A0ABV9EBD0_9ACTN|nr:hypothetical protein [Sphaerisporangium corydalis]
MILRPAVVTTPVVRPGGPATPGPGTTDQAEVEPSSPAPRPRVTFTPTHPDLGDLGDGRTFKNIRVGYLPAKLRWSKWSVNWGDKFATAWNKTGAEGDHSYCVEIYVYEGRSIELPDKAWNIVTDDGKAKEVTFWGRKGLIRRQFVGEDGGTGTPTLYMSLGRDRRVEIMLSPGYADEVGPPKAVESLLKKIATGLTTTN